MPYFTDGNLPKDVAGYPVGGVYVPNVGTVAQMGAVLGTDNDGVPYATNVASLIVPAIGLTDGVKATYAASTTALASAASCTDLFTITGSSTKIVRVTRLSISGQQTTAAAAQIVLLIRSTANATGTSTSPTVVPYDSNSAAGTAVVRAYTANPGTPGTLVGNIYVGYLFLAASGTATVGSDKLVFDFGNRPSQAVVLRGTSQVLAVNLNGATVTGGAFDINIEWTEE